jgi:hypothetical protein
VADVNELEAWAPLFAQPQIRTLDARDLGPAREYVETESGATITFDGGRIEFTPSQFASIARILAPTRKDYPR